ncbi:MAG: response regulator [Leptolyngbya sp. SIO1D8]|nr:response regulator [Leptolyngbya sp. SIO1D8]
MSHILLVEDYVPHAQLMSLDLTEAGYQVSTHRTGEAALNAVPSFPPDLIVLDWRLPGLNGVEVCRQLRQTGYTQPILFVTAMGGDEHARQGLAAGADDYLVKPVHPKTLLSAIAQHLEVHCQKADGQVA